jgi:hypothetical protein
MNELYGGKDSVSKAHGLSGQLQPATVPMALLGEIRDCNWQQYTIRETIQDSTPLMVLLVVQSYNKNLFYCSTLQH